MTAYLIYMIGFFFTAGVFFGLDKEERLGGLKLIAIGIFWPVVIGVVVGTVLRNNNDRTS